LTGIEDSDEEPFREGCAPDSRALVLAAPADLLLAALADLLLAALADLLLLEPLGRTPSLADF
jgi:hypothetical protein